MTVVLRPHVCTGCGSSVYLDLNEYGCAARECPRSRIVLSVGPCVCVKNPIVCAGCGKEVACEQ